MGRRGLSALDDTAPSQGAAGVLALLLLVRPSLSTAAVGVVDAVLALGGVLLAVSLVARWGRLSLDPDRVALVAWLAVFAAVLGYGGVAVVSTARTDGVDRVVDLAVPVALGVGAAFVALLALALALDRYDAAD